MKKLIAIILVMMTVIAMIPVVACADSSSHYVYDLTSLKPNDSYVCYNDAKTDDGFQFRVNALYSLNFDVFMDGEKIPWDTYDSYGDGAGIVFTLHQDYLDTIPTGKHVLSVWFTDGNRAKADIRVCSVNDYPLTGDTFDFAVWSSVLVLSALACAGIWISMKKKSF